MIFFVDRTVGYWTSVVDHSILQALDLSALAVTARLVVDRDLGYGVAESAVHACARRVRESEICQKRCIRRCGCCVVGTGAFRGLLARAEPRRDRRAVDLGRRLCSSRGQRERGAGGRAPHLGYRRPLPGFRTRHHARGGRGRPHYSAAVPAAGDGEEVERQPILDLFNAVVSWRMMLHANLGGHASTPRRPRTVQRMSNKTEFTSADDAA